MNKLLTKLKELEKYFSNDFYIKPATLMMLFLLFTCAFLYIKNIKDVKLYLQHKKDISIITQNNKQKQKIVKSQLKRLADIPVSNRILFSQKEVNNWKKTIQLYSIILAKNIKSNDKSILYVKKMTNKALSYRNAIHLQVYMNETIIPIRSQIVTTLFLSQFGYIKNFDTHLFNIFIYDENIKKNNKDKVKEKINKNIKNYIDIKKENDEI